MNQIKPYLISSAVLGIILGILSTIPFINVIAITALFVLTGIFSLVQFVIKNPKTKPSLSETLYLSGGGGFVAAFCSCIVFVPIAIIFNVFGFTALLEGINPIILAFLAFFFAVLCAMTNAFIGSGFIYIYNLFKK